MQYASCEACSEQQQSLAAAKLQGCGDNGENGEDTEAHCRSATRRDGDPPVHLSRHRDAHVAFCVRQPTTLCTAPPTPTGDPHPAPQPSPSKPHTRTRLPHVVVAAAADGGGVRSWGGAGIWHGRGSSERLSYSHRNNHTYNTRIVLEAATRAFFVTQCENGRRCLYRGISAAVTAGIEPMETA